MNNNKINHSSGSESTHGIKYIGLRQVQNCRVALKVNTMPLLSLWDCRKSMKDRQYNDKKKDKRPNNNLQSTT